MTYFENETIFQIIYFSNTPMLWALYRSHSQGCRLTVKCEKQFNFQVVSSNGERRIVLLFNYQNKRLSGMTVAYAASQTHTVGGIKKQEHVVPTRLVFSTTLQTLLPRYARPALLSGLCERATAKASIQLPMEKRLRH